MKVPYSQGFLQGYGGDLHLKDFHPTNQGLKLLPFPTPFDFSTSNTHQISIL